MGSNIESKVGVTLRSKFKARIRKKKQKKKKKIGVRDQNYFPLQKLPFQLKKKKKFYMSWLIITDFYDMFCFGSPQVYVMFGEIKLKCGRRIFACCLR